MSKLQNRCIRGSRYKVMNSVSVQIQRAINDAISNQVLPQIQNALRAGSGPVTQKRWNVSAERPERVTEDDSNLRIRSSSKSEPFRNRLHDENADSTYDTYILPLRNMHYLPRFYKWICKQIFAKIFENLTVWVDCLRLSST